MQLSIGSTAAAAGLRQAIASYTQRMIPITIRAVRRLHEAAVIKFWSLGTHESRRIARQRSLLRHFFPVYGDWQGMVLVDAQSHPVVWDHYVLPFDDHSDLDTTGMPDVDRAVVDVYQDLGSHRTIEES
jgi:hypothetical protein